VATGDKQLPPLRRIQTADVPGAEPWFGPFLDNLNRVLEYLYVRFDKGISLAGNISGIVKELEVRTGTTYVDGEFSVLRFDAGFSPITAVIVAKVMDRDAPTAVLSGAFSADWRSNGKEVSIRWISGLEPERRYTVSLLVL
jgi:hypothetical protein